MSLNYPGKRSHCFPLAKKKKKKRFPLSTQNKICSPSWVSGCLYNWAWIELDLVVWGVGGAGVAWEETPAATFYPNFPPPPLLSSHWSKRTHTESHTFLSTLFSLYPSTPHCKHALMWTHNIALCTTMNKQYKTFSQIWWYTTIRWTIQPVKDWVQYRTVKSPRASRVAAG